jgi:hypothetical protein
MPEVFAITVQIKPPSRRLPAGQVAHGYFTFVDGVVTVTDCDGHPVRDEHGRLYTRNLILALRLSTRKVPPASFSRNSG